jgi:hypothetical protein
VSADREVLELECQLRLIEHIDANPPPEEPMDLWIDGFWAAVAALRNPRAPADVLMAIEMRRSVHRHQQEERHAQHRSRPAAVQAPGRTGNQAADDLTAYLTEAYGPQRDRRRT